MDRLIHGNVKHKERNEDIMLDTKQHLNYEVVVCDCPDGECRGTHMICTDVQCHKCGHVYTYVAERLRHRCETKPISQWTPGWRQTDDRELWAYIN